jgi:hypothetical protein
MSLLDSAWFVDAKSFQRAIAPSDQARAAPSRAPPRGRTYFFFSFLLFHNFFYISYAYNLSYGKSYTHTTRDSHKQLCTQLVVREKIYTQVIQQIIMYTSCTHKFCAPPNLCLKLIWQKFIVQSYMSKLCTYISSVPHDSLICSFGWWLMAGTDLFWEKVLLTDYISSVPHDSLVCSFGWWLMAGTDLFWEKKVLLTDY